MSKRNVNRLNIPIMLLVLGCSVLVSKYTQNIQNTKWECSNMVVEKVQSNDSGDTLILASK